MTNTTRVETVSPDRELIPQENGNVVSELKIGILTSYLLDSFFDILRHSQALHWSRNHVLVHAKCALRQKIGNIDWV